MRQGKTGAAMVFVLLATAGCGSAGSGSHALTSKQLASYVIRAPDGYMTDQSPSASGQMTEAIFREIAGTPSAKGFAAGFRQTYLNENTGEGIVITLIEFKSDLEAAHYLKATEYKTLSSADARYEPFPLVAGAVEADGTKAYGGEYSNAVVLSTGKFYMQLLYANSSAGQKPIEFREWVQAQWQLLARVK